jgi:hypothetical protein
MAASRECHRPSARTGGKDANPLAQSPDFRLKLFSRGKAGLVSAKKLLAGRRRFCIISLHWFVLLTIYGNKS